MSNMLRVFSPTVAGFLGEPPTKPGGEGNLNPDVFGKVLDDAKQNADGVAKVPKPPNDNPENGDAGESAVALPDGQNINPFIPKIVTEPDLTVNGPIAQNNPEQLDALNKSGIAADNNPLPLEIPNGANAVKTENMIQPSKLDEWVQSVVVNPAGLTAENDPKAVSKDSGRNPNETSTDLSGDKGKSDKDLTQNDPEDDGSEEANLNLWTTSATMSATMSAMMANVAVTPTNHLDAQTQSAFVSDDSDVMDELGVTNSTSNQSVEPRVANRVDAQRSRAEEPSVVVALDGTTTPNTGAPIFEQSVRKAFQTVATTGDSVTRINKPANGQPAYTTESFTKESPSLTAAQNPSIPDSPKIAGTQNGSKEFGSVRTESEIPKGSPAVSGDVAITQNPTIGSPAAIRENRPDQNSASVSANDFKADPHGGVNPEPNMPVNSEKNPFVETSVATSGGNQPPQLDSSGVNSAQSNETTGSEVIKQADMKPQTVSAMKNVGSPDESKAEIDIQSEVYAEDQNSTSPHLQSGNNQEINGRNSVDLHFASIVTDKLENPVPEITVKIPSTATNAMSTVPKTNSAPQVNDGLAVSDVENNSEVRVEDSTAKPNLLDLKSLQSFQVPVQSTTQVDGILARLKPVALVKNTSTGANTAGEADDTPVAGSVPTPMNSIGKKDSMALKIEASPAKTDSGSNNAGTAAAAAVIVGIPESASVNQNVLPFNAVSQKTGNDIATDQLAPMPTDGVKNANGPLSEKVVEFKPAKSNGKTGVGDDFKSTLTAQQPVVSAQTGPDKADLQNAATPVPSHKDVFDQIMERAKIMVNRGHSEMEVSLKPDHLGKLQLRVAIENQVVTAKFAVESQQVKEIIETNLPQLRQQLHDQGIRADALTVSVNLQNNGSDWQQPSGQQSQSNFSQTVMRGKTEMTADIPEKTGVNRPVQNTLVDFIA